MIQERTAATNNLYKGYNSLPLKQENSWELRKQYKDASALLEDEIPFGNPPENVSDEVLEQIHDSDSLDVHKQRPSNWLFAGISWEAWKELLPFRETEVSPTTDVVEATYKNIILGEMLERLDVIAQRADNWDGLGSLKPNKISLDRADCIMMKLLDSVISNGVEWTEPYICSDEDGYVTVEWTGGKRQLYLRIEEDEVEYITLERINTKRKMGGDTIRGDDCFEIWKWLINEQQ